MANKYIAFTARTKGLARKLVTECGVSGPFVPKTQKGTYNPVQFKGLWDTGATGSVITETVAKTLKLKPSGKATVNHAGGTSVVDTYFVNLYLPNKMIIPMVKVTVGMLADADLLIGMDVIGLGDFTVTNSGNRTTFCFAAPSLGEIDLTEKANNRNKALETPVLAEKKHYNNEILTVKYKENGRVVKGKFKTFKRDIDNGDCEIV